MPQNIGKIFEAQWHKSTPDYALLYRLPDPAQSFGDSKRLRFSRKPGFDYLLWDSRRHILYALELKTVKGKSISFERTEEERGDIHYEQIDALNKWNRYDGIICGFVIEFRQMETTVFLHIDHMNRIINEIPKKSFSFNDLEKYDIRYTVLGQQKLRTKYLYDVDGFLKINEAFYLRKEEDNGEKLRQDDNDDACDVHGDR